MKNLSTVPRHDLRKSKPGLFSQGLSLNRRRFLAASASVVATSIPVFCRAQQPLANDGKIKRMAVITTLWNYRSHAWHMAERFLHGYPREGRWHRPLIQVVSAYVDQQPSGDLSRRRSQALACATSPTVSTSGIAISIHSS